MPLLRADRAHITLADGRRIRGFKPGFASQLHLEYRLRDLLAEQLRGITEAVLPYGRADIMTDKQVFEVEPAGNWRHGVRQALAYSAQCGLPPAVALFGPATHPDVVKMYLKLRDSSPPIVLWWFNGYHWHLVASRRKCYTMRAVADAALLRGPAVETAAI